MLRHEFDCAAVMKTVCKLDQNNAYVVIQSQEDSLEVLSLHALLLGLVLVVEYGLDLSQTFYNSRNLLSKEVCQVFYCIFCIFYNIMKEGCYNRLISQTDIADDNLCHSNRMEDIWLSRSSSYSLVRLICKVKCFLDYLEFRWVITTLARCFHQICEVSCNDLVVLCVKFRYLAHNLYIC